MREAKYYDPYGSRCNATDQDAVWVDAGDYEEMRQRVTEAAELLRWARHYNIQQRPEIDAWFERVNRETDPDAEQQK